MSATPSLEQVIFLVVSIDGTPVESELLLDVRTEVASNLPARAEIRLRYELANLAHGVGKALEIKLLGTVVFKGEIVAVGVEVDASGGYQELLTAYDKSHRLARGSHARTWLHSSYSDVIGTIAGECGGLSPSVTGAALTASHPYIIQTGNNFDFLNEIALRTGSEWFVDGATLKVQERPTSGSAVGKVTLGVDLLRLRARYSAADFSDEVDVKIWDPAQKATVTGVDSAAGKANYATATIASSGKSGAASLGSVKLQTSSLQAMTQAEANAIAKGLATRAGSATLLLKGECYPFPELKPGTWLTVADAGAALNGDYYVTAVEHVLGIERPATTRFTAGGVEPSGIVDLLGQTDTAVSPFSRHGVVIGIVTDNTQTTESGKPGPGRVMVKFPTLADDVVSAPARIVSFDAGSGRGTLFIPEINDEVLVAFEHGDTRRPVILGSLWNSTDKVPTLKDGGVADSKVTARVIRTRLGHALTFSDGTDDATKNVNILLADGTTSVLLSHEKIVISNSKLPISITNAKASIDFTDAGDITIKGAAITIDGKSVTITAKEALTAKGQDVTVDAGAGLTLTGKSASKLESKATLTIKGSMVSIN